MALTIKRAFLKDIDFLIETRLKVLREVFSIPPGQDMADLAKANRKYYTHTIPIGEHIACVAFDEGVFAGCGGICLYQEMPSPDNPSGLCGYLMNIYTHPEFRKKGVGEQVVSWLVEHAQQRGVTKIFLETSPMGRSLYEKMGFTPMKNEMQLVSYNGKENKQ